MAQYQILARKPLGPFGTGPKIQGVEKQRRNAASATPSRVRRTAAARRRPPSAQRAAHFRTLRAAPPAIGTVATCSTVPPCARYSATAPGSDQIHKESGTSTVGGGRSPNPVHDWKQDSFVSFPGFTAGRGFDLAGGAPGDG
ncbi:hypothetical protein F511_20189 [Dorcoceras hygrometricum]|uniref:Uncharacterized protein n=1 Tax=Dorcoceras hygrometricum TaxID=472368 RepID=A0A2Z7A235_9LAMI|nr:hypothetical protein F511_20189 [Dorcoceras hygrometricum]